MPTAEDSELKMSEVATEDANSADTRTATCASAVPLTAAVRALDGRLEAARKTGTGTLTITIPGTAAAPGSRRPAALQNTVTEICNAAGVIPTKDTPTDDDRASRTDCANAAHSDDVLFKSVLEHAGIGTSKIAT